MLALASRDAELLPCFRTRTVAIGNCSPPPAQERQLLAGTAALSSIGDPSQHHQMFRLARRISFPNRLFLNRRNWDQESYFQAGTATGPWPIWSTTDRIQRRHGRVSDTAKPSANRSASS